MDTSLAQRIELVKGDITSLAVDAIVNAANTSLLGGGGVDGRIHRVAGPELLAECRTLGGCPTGSAKITRGYRLPARHVIHAVGPVYRDGRSGEPELLAGCYRTALKLAVENGCRSIAFPAISCGVYGYPLEEAARIAFHEVIEFLRADTRIERVLFVLYDDQAFGTYQKLYSELVTSKKEGLP
ncbi:MAG TPA: O-acetyl-ADP-ribose deacetylase [Phycisphaerae bacterium]|jgi:O-acetyl-ADP-ribose deacetylase (regulator of RNase III)|nr:O-acetyl-ADP-ribose deacetylase [Phycisphaerae bacterium]HOB73108.1 O-acetyl-ADP-ribose deacetylase [Phycisphaerae bacterium]HOJ54011.1 O-acetyl-ADP-ribose deacetylase [Phycisphaerae bacterium]HOL26422.1 O-acetyl-ADP-ribose deacetylase [Phycisphaerae bacterium]HPP20401.1 O-acetyl-ADP-ribose deacetylase [Phycisphaerae bacterium]